MERDPVLISRRVAPDRRLFSWRTILFGYLRSRRIAARRDGQTQEVFGDWHHPWLFFLALGIMVLSCADAFLTLQLISRGMIEANPLMAAMMSHGTAAFVTTKVAVTGLAILTLVFFSRVQFFNVLRTGILLTLFFCLYSCLICYELICLFGMN